MAVATLGSRPVAMLAMVILARLLDPADFGTIALAMVLFSTTKQFSGLGLAEALIQSDRKPNELAFQVFVVQMSISIVLFLVVFFNPLFFARILGNLSVVPVIQWLSLTIVLNAMALVPAALLRKELRFGQMSKAMLASNISNNVVAISLAFLGFGLWSLVYGQLVGVTIRVAMIWWACPGWSWLIPKRWEQSAMVELFRYGRHKTGSGLMSFFNSNWDDWMVGRALGPSALGFYDKAYGLTNGTIVGFNRSVLNGVLFPAYSKIRDDKERLSRAYIKGLGLAALVMAPLSMGMFAVASVLVPVLFGDKWLPMVPVLQMFSFMALFRPLAGSTGPLFQSLGRPDLNFRVGVLITIVMVPLVLILLDWGIVGVAFAVTVSYIIGFLVNVYQVHRLLPGTASKMLPAIAPSLIASVVMIIAVMATRALLSTALGIQDNLFMLISMIVVGAAAYLLTAYFLQREAILEVIGLVRSVLNGKGKRFRLPGVRKRISSNPKGTG